MAIDGAESGAAGKVSATVFDDSKINRLASAMSSFVHSSRPVIGVSIPDCDAQAGRTSADGVEQPSGFSTSDDRSYLLGRSRGEPIEELGVPITHRGTTRLNAARFVEGAMA